IRATLPSPISVLVADSNQMQCQLLVSALRRRPEFHVVSCPLDAEAILRLLAASLSIDVMVINSAKPGELSPDLSIVRRLHLSHPEIAKIVLQDACDREVVVNAFRSRSEERRVGKECRVRVWRC